VRLPFPTVRQLSAAGMYSSPPQGVPNTFIEDLRELTMSVGTYSIPEGGLDDQTPHREDEIYVVMKGRGQFTCRDDMIRVMPGDVLFVGAGEEHRFHDITEDLALLVVFAPPYSGDRQ
jgi:mannose-6-phosphate isomerase-like protein (cupin superfamily)